MAISSIKKAKIWFLTLVAISCDFTHAGVTSAAQSIEKRDQASYFIQGAVRKPGVYKIEGSASVLKLIAMAGGLSETHGATAFIIRRTKPPKAATESTVRRGDEFNLIRIDITGLLKGEALMNAELLRGDILNIPLADVFFIQGEANRISSFPIREGLRLSQAVSLASRVTPCRSGRPCIAGADSISTVGLNNL